MAHMTWRDMRKEALSQLISYRRNNRILRELDGRAPAPQRLRRSQQSPEPLTPDSIAHMRLWRQAIERARAAVAAQDPLKERFMVRYFAMRVPQNRRQSQRARHVQLMEELHVSDSTLYKWKEGILQLVIAFAIEAGALRPFTPPDEPD